MSYAPLLRVKELEQTVRALMSLVEQRAREVDDLKSNVQAVPRRGRPPKESYHEQH